VATAELYPKVVLGVTAGSTGVINDYLTNPTNTYGIGPGITWQLNQTVARAKIAQAKAATQAQLARFDGTVLTALRETETSLNSYSHDLERDADLKRVRDRAKESEGQAEQLYASGRVDYLTLLDAQRTLAGAETAVATSHAQLAQDQVTIFLALGGGWEEEKDGAKPAA
jgi:outer membrane protein, multidrug efflux system